MNFISRSEALGPNDEAFWDDLQQRAANTKPVRDWLTAEPQLKAVAADTSPRSLLRFPDDGSQPRPGDGNAIMRQIIGLRSTGALIGPSSVGKTTMIIDFGFHVAHGRDYYGKSIRRYAVLLVGYEGDNQLDDAVAAAVRVHGHPGTAFARLTLAPSLARGDDGDAGVALIIQSANELRAAAGCDVGFIIVDTAARARAGDDEDSAKDTSFFVEHRAQAIANATGAAFCVVHHTGKDPTRGSRGSSALPAAADWLLSINDRREVIVEKSRIGPSGYTLFAYDLREIELRTDSYGLPITACVIEPKAASNTNGRAPQKKKLTTAAKRARQVLERLYEDGDAQDVPASKIGLEGISKHKLPRVVAIDRLKEKCAKARLSADGAPNAERMAFGRALDALEEAGVIARHDEYVWLLGQQRKSAGGVP